MSAENAAAFWYLFGESVSIENQASGGANRHAYPIALALVGVNGDLAHDKDSSRFLGLDSPLGLTSSWVLIKVYARWCLIPFRPVNRNWLNLKIKSSMRGKPPYTGGVNLVTPCPSLN
jgi:hypothetical protein